MLFEQITVTYCFSEIHSTDFDNLTVRLLCGDMLHLMFCSITCTKLITCMKHNKFYVSVLCSNYYILKLLQHVTNALNKSKDETPS